MDFAVIGVPAAAIIVAVIQLAKRYGLNSRWAALVSVGLGVILSVAVYLAGINPQFAVWLKVVMTGLLTGFGAAGIYSSQKALRGK